MIPIWLEIRRFLKYEPDAKPNIKKNSPEKEPFRSDADTILSKHSLDAALKATGSVCKAVDVIFQKKFNNYKYPSYKMLNFD